MDNSMKNTASLIHLRAARYITLAISLLCFLIFYIPETLRFSIDEWVLYLSFFIRKLASTLLPVLAASALLSSSGTLTLVKRILPAISVAAPRLIYLLPYNYLRYMAEAFDSLESLGLMLVRSSIEILVYAIELYIYCLIGEFFYKRRGARFENFYDKVSLFDFDSAANYSFFAIAFARFTVDLIIEISYVINYIIEYAETYRLSEVYFILCKFLFILFSLIASYSIIYLINRCVKRISKNNA